MLMVLFSGEDARILKHIQQPTESQTHTTAEWVSESGEFQYSTLVLAGICLLLSIWKRGLRKTAVVVLVAGLLGGVLVNVFRPTFGRARPQMEENGRFTFFRMNSRYQGFPSGHTTSTTASLSALAFRHPAVAIPAWIGSVGVGWSRMQVNRHYLSDVMGGLMLGSFCGYWAFWIYKERREDQESGDKDGEG